MAIDRFHYADFGGTVQVPGPSGEITVTLPTRCSSLIINFMPGIGDDFEVMLNPHMSNEQGGVDYEKHYTVFPPGMILTINNYYIDEFSVRSTANSWFSYLAIVQPDSNISYQVVRS